MNTKIPEHPLFIKREANSLFEKVSQLIKIEYLIKPPTIVEHSEIIAYLHYAEDADIRTFD